MTRAGGIFGVLGYAAMIRVRRIRETLDGALSLIQGP